MVVSKNGRQAYATVARTVASAPVPSCVLRATHAHFSVEPMKTVARVFSEAAFLLGKNSYQLKVNLQLKKL
jgi:hypothetical protein